MNVMKTMKEMAEVQPINEAAIYDDVIQKLTEAKENGTPIDEGVIGAIAGGMLGATVGPKLMQAICKALGVDVKGTFGSLLTSKLIMGSVGTAMGWRL